jgi:hypothetical protein
MRGIAFIAGGCFITLFLKGRGFSRAAKEAIE